MGTGGKKNLLVLYSFRWQEKGRHPLEGPGAKVTGLIVDDQGAAVAQESDSEPLRFPASIKC